MEYSVDSISNNCYEGTTCLINKFNIQDEDKLAELEAMITLAKTSELELATLKDGFNEDDYRAIHRQLFDTLYDWAGEYRTIDISKKGTAFADKNDISELLTNCFKRLKSMDYFRGLCLMILLRNWWISTAPPITYTRLEKATAERNACLFHNLSDITVMKSAFQK